MRPRRSAAIESVKRATKSLNSNEKPAPTARKSSQRKIATQTAKKPTASSVESENDSSELSDAESEEEEGSDHFTHEHDESSSGSETEGDKGSDYETRNQKRKRGTKVTSQKKGPTAKRAKKSTMATQKAAEKKTTSRGKKERALKAGQGRGKQNASKEALPIREDNKLFNCIKEEETDLQETAEEWVAYYQDNPAMSLAQLINCFFRCSGCNATIDEVQVMDHDEIADILDLVQAEMKTGAMPSYPLVTRSTTFRKFRRRLSDWMEKLFICVDEADIVYDDTMMGTVIAWISAMTTSAYRSMRHTSTLISLLIVEQLNRMSAANRAEINAAVKARDAERARGTTTANKIRVQDLSKKIQSANQVKRVLDALIQEMFDTVFIHRYRDSDPAIRAECITELGRWMKTYSDKYMQPSYFGYIGWSLSDMSEKVRLSAIKSLSSLYSRFEYEGSFQQFTERFLPRMLEMAVSDIDSTVRASAIAALVQIDEHDVLEEEARDSFASHIFDVDPKVRMAVAGYIRSRLNEKQRQEEEDEEEEDAVEGATSPLEEGKMRWKSFAEMLARLGQSLEQREASQDSSGSSDGGSGSSSNVELAVGESSSTSSRLTLALGAVYDIDEKLQDWNSLIQLLLYDHSSQGAAEKNKKKNGGRKKATAAAGASSSLGNTPPDKEQYRLSPAEESILVEALPVVLERIQTQDSVPKKSHDAQAKDGETMSAHTCITRDLIPVLPKLFKKYRTEANRIADVLAVIKHLKMDAYVEFQQVGGFESLWDEVIDQFLRHVEKVVLSNAMEAMTTMKQAKSLSNVNEAKMTFLRQTVFQSLQNTVDGDDADVMSEESLHQNSVCVLRILFLIRRNDLCQEMEERYDDDLEEEAAAAAAGAHGVSSRWDVILTFAKRGVHGHKREEAMVVDSITVLTLYIMWSARQLRAMEEGEEKEAALTALCDKRSRCLDVLHTLLDQENEVTSPTVKRQAFRQIVDLHILFAALDASSDQERSAEAPSLRLKCSLETQATLNIFVTSELSHYPDEIKGSEGEEGGADSAAEEDDEEEEDDSDDDDSTVQAKKGPLSRQKKKKATTTSSTTKKRQGEGRALPTLEFLQREMNFISTISHFISAIRLGIVHVKYSVGLLSRYSRIGPIYDACLRVLVELLRDVGIHEGRPEQVCKVILDSLWEAHHHYCRDEHAGENGLISLAKMLSSSLVVRGAQLAIAKSIDGQAVVEMHDRGIRFALEMLTRLNHRAEKETTEKQREVLVFFKALSQLLVSVGPKEAITIKKGMDKLLVEFEIEVPISSKMWDPLRQYEKRLVTIASKSDSVRKYIEESKGVGARKQQQLKLKPRPNPSIVQQMQGEEEEEESGEEDEGQWAHDTHMEDDSRLIEFAASEGDGDLGDLQRMDMTLESVDGEGEDDDDDEEEEMREGDDE
ncbi:hypothetical protein CBS101457_005997 [Exobasidium rhododendri]|nr:hypothetical protein CBS101457_005997 [Exobasidium rhododendri]